MKLEQWPETEMDYWQTIEGIGGFLWATNHELWHGHIENSPNLQTELKEARNIQTQLVEELFENFGVIHPKDSPKRNAVGCFPTAPFGMKWHSDWYKEMEKKNYQAEYEKIICSACPLSDGLDKRFHWGALFLVEFLEA